MAPLFESLSFNIVEKIYKKCYYRNYMPIYEYKCELCSEQFEKIVPISQVDNSYPCPKCGEKKTKKMVSRTNFTLKGAGWAKDGYSK